MEPTLSPQEIVDSGPNPAKQAILASARRLFAQNGFDAASVQEIAGQAGVNKALIYYYFRDKDALYREVLEECYSPVLAIWEDESFPRAGTPTDKLLFFTERFIRYQEENEDLRRILAHEFTRDGKHVQWIAEKYASRNRENLMKILTEGMQRGDFRPLNPEIIVNVLFGAILFQYIMRPLARHLNPNSDFSAMTPEILHQNLTNLLLDGLARKAT